MRTFALPGMMSSTTLPAQDIYLLGDCFKMTWVHAATISTEVIYGHAIGNRADQKMISDPMSTLRAPAALEESITVLVGTGQPIPTAICLFYLRPKTHIRRIDATIVTVDEPPCLVASITINRCSAPATTEG